jgi:glycosyltransferase involved in cell wall biosynthesis
MPLLSVLTAAHAGRADLLARAGESVAAQRLPDDWRLEWVVQEDGAEPSLAGVVERFPFGRHAAHGEQLGIATTRNLALTRVDGELVHVLDSDDELLPDAISVAVEAFQAHQTVHWVAAQADDLLPDDTRRAYQLRYPTGYVEPGKINDFTAEHGEPPIHCAGLTMRTSTVRALGGWAANPRSEDSALFVALAELTPGYITPEVTWLHRLHASQTTGERQWRTLRAESVTMVRQRLAALRELGLELDA